jgi:hypothetical protein
MPWLQERAFWWIVRRVCKVQRVGGLEFVDLRSRLEPPTERILEALRVALDQVALAGRPFQELVSSHLRFVVATRVTRGNAFPLARALSIRFAERELTNRHYLACELVWAATYIQLSRESMDSGQRVDKAAIRRAAFEQKVRFVNQFPDAAEWEAYLQLQGP